MKEYSRQIVRLLICLSIFQYGYANEMKVRESGTPEIVTTIKYILDEVLTDLNSPHASKNDLNRTLQIQEISLKGENVTYEETISQDSVDVVETEELQRVDHPVKRIYEYSQEKTETEIQDSVILPVFVNAYKSAVMHTNKSNDENTDLPVNVYPLKSIYEYFPQKTKIDVGNNNDEPKKTANELGMIAAAEYNSGDDEGGKPLNEEDNSESDSRPLKTIYQHKADQHYDTEHSLQTVNNSSDNDFVITLMTGHIIANKDINDLVDTHMMDYNMSSDKDHIEDPTTIMPTVV